MSAKAKQTNKSADKNANDRNDVASKENYAEKANPQWKCISHEQINTLLDLTVEQVQLQFEEILGLKNCLTCLKEASLLGYFVCGFWWARQMNYTCQQISFIMALQQLVLDNIRVSFRTTTSMSFSSTNPERSYSLGRRDRGPACLIDGVLLTQGQRTSQEEDGVLLTQGQRTSQEEDGVLLTQGQRSSQEEDGVLLTQGQRSSQEEDGEVAVKTDLQEKEKKDTGFEGYNIQDVKDVLGDLTTEMLGNLQAEFTEKLRVQEESFRTRLERLKHSASK
ncbi:uncharacterized protein LOC121563787 isoform X5 [Coregonus clupeaformis]|uniref:uncharacterized protein LOC121563787 isoform X5 n=1 Tax=Coregonus clupeaformis TaxID=59861 RepID=UPI001BDFC341|nr:uncharacterized protein LOC121563787 isoform X5 [Coregonus clupeaformis]